MPGRVALAVDKNILNKISHNYKVILITGTNGKTTTTSMIADILTSSNLKVITNSTGANMLSGVTCCFVENFSFRDRSEKWAVIEVDEAYLSSVTKRLSAQIIVVTNIFRDQLDRYQELYMTVGKILDGIKNNNDSTLVLNGDCSILGGLELPNKKVYYGFSSSVQSFEDNSNNADMKFCKFCSSKYEYNNLILGCLGDFYCSNCGYKREELTYICGEVEKLTPSFSEVEFNETKFNIMQPGVYNIYNALCAYSVAKLIGLDDQNIREVFESYKTPFGRGEIFDLEGRVATIFLVKNPTGYNQVINTISAENEDYDCCFFINDNYADGVDTSWIWDVDFEKIANTNIKNIFASGIRAYDMAVRLKIAGLPQSDIFVDVNFDEIVDKILKSDSKKIYILTTYTAMLEFRKKLYFKGYIKKIW